MTPYTNTLSGKATIIKQPILFDFRLKYLLPGILQQQDMQRGATISTRLYDTVLA